VNFLAGLLGAIRDPHSRKICGYGRFILRQQKMV